MTDAVTMRARRAFTTEAYNAPVKQIAVGETFEAVSAEHAASLERIGAAERADAKPAEEVALASSTPAPEQTLAV